MSQAIEPDLTEATEAMSRRDWGRAFTLLDRGDQGATLSAEALPLLATAAYLSGHPDVSRVAWERAYSTRMRADDRMGAAEAALHVAELCLDGDLFAPLNAWLSRAEDLLGEDDTILSGTNELIRSTAALAQGDTPEALRSSRRALELANRYADADTAALARLALGRALVTSGEMEEGLRLLDEAVRSAAAGELDPSSTSIVYCGVLCSWQALSDYDRADQWTTSMKMFCDANDVGSYHGRCRVHRAQIMRLRGSCTDAEAELQRAAEEIKPYSRGVELGWVSSEIGSVRLRLGDLTGAEEAFVRANELGWEPQPGMALLKLARGDAKGASASIRNALDHMSDAPSFESPPHSDLRRAPLLAARSEIALAAGDSEGARWAAEELDAVAASYGGTAFQALASSARGTAALLSGDHGAARRAYRESVRLWQEVSAPYEAARGRVHLAAVFEAEGDRDAAVMELRAALATFERVGASIDRRRAAEALARLEPADPASRAVKVFMFTDIVRSTDLIEAIGDEAWGHLVRWHNDAVSSIVAEHGGEVVQTTGDGFFLTFDDAGPAVACSVAIQRALAAHRKEHGFAPRVRIGLHQAEATRDGANWSGKGVHAAARIGAMAEPEEILVSVDTGKRAGGGELGAARTVELKGVAEPVQVATVAWR